MMRQKRLLMMVAGIAVLALGSALHAGTTVAVAGHVGITPHAGLGVWIGGPPRAPVCHAPPHREVVVAGPWRHRFVHLGAPRAEVVVVPPPPVRRIVIERPPVVVHKVPPCVMDGPVTVWITNSNGSRTCVKLTRRGSSYIGPRGEYYTGMPTNEPLRMVYGF